MLKGTIKTSSRAAAIRCLGEIASIYCLEFCKYFFRPTAADAPPQSDPTAATSDKEATRGGKRFVGLVPPLFAELLDLLDYPDPLIRGNICHVLGSFLKGFLSSQLPVKKSEFEALVSRGSAEDATPTTKESKGDTGGATEHKKGEKEGEDEDVLLVHFEKLIAILLSELEDESANTCATACRAIGECFPAIANSHLALSQCLDIVETVLRNLKAETYWLVKTEVHLFDLVYLFFK